VSRFKSWLLSGQQADHKAAPEHQDNWLKVMCLTGVDYFSTLGYQPGIAYLAAGVLSPMATGIVVLVTLFGLVPLYSKVAKESPFGQGSIAMLENFLPGWQGKTFILVLLGFAATSWIVTITLSSADAAAHIVENPFFHRWPHDQLVITCSLLTILGLVFLRGFREAISVSVLIVVFYSLCNSVVLVRSMMEIAAHPDYVSDWQASLFTLHHNIPTMIGVSLILFPKLALGMSGFETGVAVMPLVDGGPDEDPQKPKGRIRNTRKLLLTAALIMAVGLMVSSFVTTLLIPVEVMREGGEANGRALAYLAHRFLGDYIGTVYDISTILILWFAGASAMAGLLNLVPRYLPRYGMAPHWAKAQRPLVFVFTVLCFVVTFIFDANVDAQAGAYATGVLVLFTSAAFAVMLSLWRRNSSQRLLFGLVFLMFVYTTITNMIERPEGVQIASFFVIAMLVTSLLSRALRSLELRIHDVQLDEVAQSIIESSLKHNRKVHLLAKRPDDNNYSQKEFETRSLHILSAEDADFVFIEVTLSDPSEFGEHTLKVSGFFEQGHPVLKCQSPAIPNAIAATLLHLRETTNTIPHVYFGWTEGHPLSYIFKYVFFGEGETAPVTREILRRVECDPERRPRVIVG